MPVCTKIQGSSSPGSCPVLDRERQIVEIAHGCPSWVFINADARGYYRTAYPPEMLRAMAPEIETALTAPERLTLVEDEWALVRAGRHTAGDYLTIASGFGDGTTRRSRDIHSSGARSGQCGGRLDLLDLLGLGRVPEHNRLAGEETGSQPAIGR